ncbi:transposase [Streptomyces sp. NPDC057910]|uniref:transposase n=1 Tax=Streptomyces sp. NPDC057910 TaxID=3346278 RepID=UPI0036EAF293
MNVAEFAHRYGERVNGWTMPSSKTKRDRLAVVFGQDALTLCRAAWADGAPAWIRRIVAVALLRQVLVQTFCVHTTSRGKEVVSKREAEVDGVPPGSIRLTSPYDADARWAANGEDLFWLGYKVHPTETCHAPTEAEAEAEAGDADTTAEAVAPSLITDVMTTHAAVPDVKATAPIQQRLTDHQVKPGEHYLGSGYPSADLIHEAAGQGITMVTPALLDHSPQAKAEAGFAKSAFTIDWNTRQVRCPTGQTSNGWFPVTQHNKDAIVVQFPRTCCHACPVQQQCTTSRRGIRTLTLRPRELHETLEKTRAAQRSNDFKERYKLRAGVEGTINQALDVTGIRRARYRGLPNVRLQHAFSATAIHIIRLDAYWNGHPLDHNRTNRLTRLSHQLAS